MLDVWGFWSSSDRLTLPAMKKDAWNQLSKRLSVIVCDQISAKVCCEALRRAILISPSISMSVMLIFEMCQCPQSGNPHFSLPL